MWTHFTKYEQTMILFILTILAVGFTIREVCNIYAPSKLDTMVTVTPVPKPTPEDGSDTDKIDINNATAEELDSLPSIGEVRAKAIIKWREENGGFKTIEDLDKVKGIGDTFMERLRPFITVKVMRPPAATALAAPVNAAVGPMMISPQNQTSMQININTASLNDLMRLKGVGKAKAETIISHRRTYGGFQNPTDIQKVRGIGAKIYNDNIHLISVR